MSTRLAAVMAASLVALAPLNVARAAEATPRPKAHSYSTDDLEQYKKMRPKTASTPFPDGPAVAAPLSREEKTARILTDLAKKPYSRKVPIQVDPAGAPKDRKDESQSAPPPNASANEPR